MGLIDKLRGAAVFGKITSLGAITATSSVSAASVTATGAVSGASLAATSSATCGSLKVNSASITSSTSTVLTLTNSVQIGESARTTQIGVAVIHITTTGALEWYSTSAGAWKTASTA